MQCINIGNHHQCNGSEYQSEYDPNEDDEADDDEEDEQDAENDNNYDNDDNDDTDSDDDDEELTIENKIKTIHLFKREVMMIKNHSQQYRKRKCC